MKEAVSAEDDFLAFFFTLIKHDRLGNPGEQINPGQTLSNLDSFPTWHGLPFRVCAVKSDVQATSTLYTSYSSAPLPRWPCAGILEICLHKLLRFSKLATKALV